MPGGRLRLLFATNTLTFDGPERQALHHARRLDPNRRHARALSLREPGELAVKIQHASVQVFSGDLPEGAAADRWIQRFAASYRLTKLLRGMEIDVLHAFDLEADVRLRKAARMAGVPVIVGAYREHRAADDPWVVRSRASVGLVDAVAAPTPELADEAAERLGIARERVAVVPPVVDLVELRGMTRAEDLLEPKERVGAMLRLDAAKGVDVLFDAAERLRTKRPDLEWVVAGAGPEAMARLRELKMRGLDGTVRLAGNRNDRGAFFAGLDVFVAPGRVEGLSAALLEAAAAGVPCVAARNPSVAGAFADGVDALLVPPGDAAALADAADRLLTDRAAAARTAASARAKISERYRFEPAVVALHDLHERLAAAWSSRGGGA
jgi:glycosyltransferase involved in cell wall biosynthesis